MRYAAGAVFATVLCAALPAFAADHADGPGVAGEPAADILDFYAFMAPDDADRVVLIMTVSPFAGADATFSDAVNYTFWVTQAGGGNTMQVNCTFDAENVSCTGPGGAQATGAIGANVDGDSMQVFAGLRDDPFFFDLTAFQNTVGGAEADLFCLLDENREAADALAGQNALGLVISMPKAALTADGAQPLLQVWAATTRREG